jgi:hypothetical protein
MKPAVVLLAATLFLPACGLAPTSDDASPMVILAGQFAQGSMSNSNTAQPSRTDSPFKNPPPQAQRPDPVPAAPLRKLTPPAPAFPTPTPTRNPIPMPIAPPPNYPSTTPW